MFYPTELKSRPNWSRSIHNWSGSITYMLYVSLCVCLCVWVCAGLCLARYDSFVIYQIAFIMPLEAFVILYSKLFQFKPHTRRQFNSIYFNIFGTIKQFDWLVGWLTRPGPKAGMGFTCTYVLSRHCLLRYFMWQGFNNKILWKWIEHSFSMELLELSNNKSVCMTGTTSKVGRRRGGGETVLFCHSVNENWHWRKMFGNVENQSKLILLISAVLLCSRRL